MFDIIARSETWLSKDSTTLYTFDNYDAFRVVRDNRKGDGVVIYVNKKLNGLNVKSTETKRHWSVVCIGALVLTLYHLITI